MVDCAVRLLLCLQLVQALTPPKAADNAVGYSRIVVATPGMRRYTYDIAHDRDGRDFNIQFSPVDTDLELHNFLAEPEGRFHPEATPHFPDVPYNEEDEIQLNVKHPTQEEMEKSSKEIQDVHSAYSKKPPQPQDMLEDFDLGIMGYGDFMDMEDPRGPQYDVPNTPAPRPFELFRPNYGHKQAYLTQPKVHYPKKPIHPKSPHKGLVEKVEAPAYYGPMKFERALFTPAFHDAEVTRLADKAYSKVFMAHGFSKPVPRFYAKRRGGEGVDMAKTLFVPVLIVPHAQRSLADKRIAQLDSSTFESQRLVSKRS